MVIVLHALGVLALFALLTAPFWVFGSHEWWGRREAHRWLERSDDPYAWAYRRLKSHPQEFAYRELHLGEDFVLAHLSHRDGQVHVTARPSSDQCSVYAGTLDPEDPAFGDGAYLSPPKPGYYYGVLLAEQVARRATSR